MKHRDGELDRLLDRSLSEYSQETPRSGLEQRILANLQASVSAPRRWWIWAAAPVCAAILIAALWWSSLLTKVRPPSLANVSAPAVEKTNNSHRPMLAAASKRRPHRTAAISTTASQVPRLSTFPSQIDSAQARMLLRFVQGHPAVAKQAVIEEEEFEKLAFRNFDSAENSISEPAEER